MREEPAGTSGYLNIQNLSSVSIEDAVFYAEYYDQLNNLCFTLVLSQARNSGELGPMAPGESRVIGSFAAGLFPVSEPKEVKVHLLQQRASGQTEELHKWDVHIRTPVTVTGGIQSNLQLSSETASAREPMLDLVLANVGVNEDGLVTDVDLLHSASNKVESWFRNLVLHLTFYPATEDGKPLKGHALMMVRAALETGEGGQLVFLPPQQSPWVKSLQQTTSTDFSPVTNILLSRPTTQINRLKPTGETVSFNLPPAPPGLFQLAYEESDWSSPAVQWVRDDSMPHHLRRELARAKK